MGKITLKEFSKKLKQELIKDINYDDSRQELVILMHESKDNQTNFKRIRINYTDIAHVVDNTTDDKAVTPKAVYEYLESQKGIAWGIATLDQDAKLVQSQIPNMDGGTF